MDSIKSLQIIGSKSFGGAERWFQRFSFALAELGHPPELAVRQGYELDGDHWRGLTRHALPMRTVWDPISKREVSRLIGRRGPDIVQTYMGRATRLTDLSGQRDILHVARLGGYYKAEGYRHAHAWIGNTKGICDYLLGAGFPSARIFHIYNFTDLPTPGPPSSEFRAQLGIPEDAWVILTPGRFVPQKGHRFLLDALAQLPRTVAGRPIRQIVLGDGPLKDALHSQAKALGIDSRITWCEWARDPDPYYRLADLVVFPSTEVEPFGNVIIETWGHSKPLVTSASIGAKEITHHEEDALLFDCRNVSQMADAILRLLENDSDRAALARNGRQQAERNFSREAVMQNYLDVYRHLIAQR